MQDHSHLSLRRVVENPSSSQGMMTACRMCGLKTNLKQNENQEKAKQNSLMIHPGEEASVH